MSSLRRLRLRRLSTRPPSRPRQADQTGLGPARFYKHVSVHRDGALFTVTLDGTPVRTPHNTPLAAPTRALALALAAEWDAQHGRVRPSSMPLTSLVAAARDVVPKDRDAARREVLKFVDTDTVCIRPGHPWELVAAQNAACAPVVEHFAGRHEARLKVVRGALAAPQDGRVWEVMQGVVGGVDDYSLAALGLAAATAKSAAVAVALMEGGVDVGGGRGAARGEEDWQMRVWGCVQGGHDLDEAEVTVRLAAAEAVFRFVQMEPDKYGRQGGVRG